MQGTRVCALVWEDPTCRGAAGPVSHNYWACASGACAPQRERPRQWKARAPRWRVAPARHNWRKPSHRNEDPTQPRINKLKKKRKKSIRLNGPDLIQLTSQSLKFHSCLFKTLHWLWSGKCLSPLACPHPSVQVPWSTKDLTFTLPSPLQGTVLQSNALLNLKRQSQNPTENVT